MIQSLYTFNKNHKRYDNSVLLHLTRYGYTEVGYEEYDKGEQQKPKKEAEEFAKIRGFENLVYRMTAHANSQPYIVFYAKR